MFLLAWWTIDFGFGSIPGLTPGSLRWRACYCQQRWPLRRRLDRCTTKCTKGFCVEDFRAHTLLWNSFTAHCTFAQQQRCGHGLAVARARYMRHHNIQIIHIGEDDSLRIRYQTSKFITYRGIVRGTERKEIEIKDCEH